MKDARMVWYSLCNEVHGVDSNGDEVASLSLLGVVAKSHGVPTGYSELSYPDKKARLVAFLREFADSIEAPNA